MIGAYKMEGAAVGSDSDLGLLATLLKLKRRSGQPIIHWKERLSRPNQYIHSSSPRGLNLRYRPSSLLSVD